MLKYKHILLYGFSLAMLLFLLKWLQLRFIIIDHAFEIYIGIIAALFTGLGIWLALKLAKPKVEKVIVEKEIYIEKGNGFTRNERALRQLNLSPRELDVLELMAAGLTNQEIAGRLFVSLNTVKTHSMNLFEKMDVARRTQAVAKARELSIIP
ncbi:MAG TPA: LuxR C-terminal-related transcriptional regulator [Chitinophagaceae bacterium]|nr:LuxR C-terminal-related transcriptional regulator [Chitinophagaceae bacterium]